MHRKLSLGTREKILLYLHHPTRQIQSNGHEPGRWNTQDGIAEGASIPLKHVSEALRSLEREKLVGRGQSVHVDGGKRVRRTYLLTESGLLSAREVVSRYRNREVRVVTREGSVETTRVGAVLAAEVDFARYREFVGHLDRWNRIDLRRESAPPMASAWAVRDDL
jgi:hypothetical protein